METNNASSNIFQEGFLMEANREMAKVMANWWGDHVRTTTHHDNGDDSFAGFFAGMMADRLNSVVTDEHREKFVEILTEKLIEVLEERGRVPSCSLSCDYGPSKFLSDIAKEAGISPENFPWKTTMEADDYDGYMKVKVSAGYAAPWVQIWPEEKRI